MQTTEITCAKDLLTVERFLDFCERWKEDKRCPHVFSDYLRDWGLEKQATNADWAHKEVRKDPEYCLPNNMGYLYPAILEPTETEGVQWIWFRAKTIKDQTHHSDLYTPSRSVLTITLYDTFAQAIAAFLDLFVIPKQEDKE